GLGGEVAALPAPIGPGAGETVEDLPGRGLAHETLALRQVRQRLLVGDRTPEEFGHALFLHATQARGHAGLAEILLRQNVGRDLTPALRHLDGVVAEHDLAVGIADFRGRRGEPDACVGILPGPGESAFELHFCPIVPALSGAPLYSASCRAFAPEA